MSRCPWWTARPPGIRWLPGHWPSVQGGGPVFSIAKLVNIITRWINSGLWMFLVDISNYFMRAKKTTDIINCGYHLLAPSVLSVGVHTPLLLTSFIYTILVGGIPTPLKNMSSSVGMMMIPKIWKVIKIHVPNHQPVYVPYHPVPSNVATGRQSRKWKSWEHHGTIHAFPQAIWMITGG